MGGGVGRKRVGADKQWVEGVVRKRVGADKQWVEGVVRKRERGRVW